MRLRSVVLFLAQAVVLGLATAFILSLLWPNLIGPQTVEIRQATGLLGAHGSGPVSYSAAVDKAAPSVVNINTAKVVTVRQSNPLLEDPMFRQFFGRGDDMITPQKRIETSLGSGVILSEQGYILTNFHVIRGADAIQVTLRDGRTAAAKVVGSDSDTDIAVLKIDLKRLPAITLGQSDKLRVGDVVLAIGNPFGVGQTVTMGIVSATGRNKLGINTFENFIQTDAPINPGNSGGALIDAEGNLIGINSAIFSQSGGSQGIGFAIPVSLARGVLQEIIEHGRPVRGWLGVEAHAVTPEVAESLNLSDAEGVIVVGVYRNGPAHRAGIQPGDLIKEIDGKKITEAREALLAISAHRPGTKVSIAITRAGKDMTVDATATERPPQQGMTE